MTVPATSSGAATGQHIVRRGEEPAAEPFAINHNSFADLMVARCVDIDACGERNFRGFVGPLPGAEQVALVPQEVAAAIHAGTQIDVPADFAEAFGLSGVFGHAHFLTNRGEDGDTGMPGRAVLWSPETAPAPPSGEANFHLGEARPLLAEPGSRPGEINLDRPANPPFQIASRPLAPGHAPHPVAAGQSPHRVVKSLPPVSLSASDFAAIAESANDGVDTPRPPAKAAAAPSMLGLTSQHGHTDFVRVAVQVLERGVRVAAKVSQMEEGEREILRLEISSLLSEYGLYAAKIEIDPRDGSSSN